MTRSLLAFVLASILALPVSADFRGEVVGVGDGDTVTVLRGRVQVKVRLAKIDAPERKQPFGQRSRQSLADLVLRKEVLVVERGKDRYGRAVGRIVVGTLDANEEQVRRGMAWVFDRYVKDASLYDLQAKAKAARRRLWADKDPIPPWVWRRQKR